MMLTLLTLLTARAEEYRMNDVAGTMTLPSGWELADQGWADWELKAQSNTSLLMKLWLTPYQPELTTETAKVWAEDYKRILEGDSSLQDVTIGETTLTTLARRDTAITTLTFTHKQGGPGVAWVAGFPNNGQSIHIRVIGLKRNSKKAEEALTRLAEQLQLDAGALEPVTGVEGSGFAATLPEGWRAPHPKELDAVKKIANKMGNYDPESCFLGIRPPAGGDPDVVFSCGTYLHVGPVDEHSFDGIESEVHAKFFGNSEKPVEAATPIEIGDRTGFYYKPPIAGGTYRLALAPYDKGMMMTWAVANHLEEDGLDAAMKDLTASVKFTGPEGGQPIIGPDKWVMYYLKYRPTSPPVLLGGLAVLGLIGGGVTLVRRRKPSYELDDI